MTGTLFFSRPWIRHIKYWIVTIFFIKIAGHFPHLVENIYAQKIYPVVAVINRFSYKFIPFSLGDVLYFSAFFYLLYLLSLIIKNIKKPCASIMKLSTFFLWIVWIFYLSWGLNYFRVSLADQMQLKAQKYNLEHLKKIGLLMIERANELQRQITKNDTLAVEVPYNIDEIFQKTPEGYRNIQHLIKQEYSQTCIKTSLLSRQISYIGATGYLNPFTGEAQINALFPKIFLPDICSHEVAHQLGFAPEDEANFLGYLAATHHSDPYFQYSGYLNALQYCLIELKKYDSEHYREYIDRLHSGVMKNFAEARKFNEKYQFPVNFFKTYDVYLKMNGQTSGIQSYNEMLRLLIAYHLKQ